MASKSGVTKKSSSKGGSLFASLTTARRNQRIDELVDNFDNLRKAIVKSKYGAGKGTAALIKETATSYGPGLGQTWKYPDEQGPQGEVLLPSYSDIALSTTSIPPVRDKDKPDIVPFKSEASCGMDVFLTVMRQLRVGDLGCDRITRDTNVQRLTRTQKVVLGYLTLPFGYTAKQITSARDIVVEVADRDALINPDLHQSFDDIIKRCLFGEHRAPFAYNHIHQFFQTVALQNTCTSCGNVNLEKGQAVAILSDDTGRRKRVQDQLADWFSAVAQSRVAPACTRQGCKGSTEDRRLILDRLPHRLILSHGFETSFNEPGTKPYNDYITNVDFTLTARKASGAVINAKYETSALFVHSLDKTTGNDTGSP